jgi:glycerol-3-phosphate dehydrogenase
MRTLTTEILVIGGGSTGAGILRDAALRGFKTILVDRSDLATGTTGRYHGLLHSGGRYVVKDPASAKECIDENKILRKIAADCIEDSGGAFVLTDEDDPSYVPKFLQGCAKAGIETHEIPIGELLKREPYLSPRIQAAYWVPDGAIESWKTVWANARDAELHGGSVLTYHKVIRLIKEADTVKGAILQNMRTGEEIVVHADFVVNASGAWAGQIAHMAGVPVTVLSGKGIMIAMNHRLTKMVINRLKMPADGDILVPIRTVCVIGTTDIRVADPDDWKITDEEVQYMLDEGEKLVPTFREVRALRVWGGVRPLYQKDTTGIADTRDVTRSYALLDHHADGSAKNFITMTGGKFTTYRQMAEVTMNAVCKHLGVERACTTAQHAMPGNADAKYYWLGSRLHNREANMHEDQLLCECEMITRKTFLDEVQKKGTDLDDIRRGLRLGMGPCQGGFCMLRAAGAIAQNQVPSSQMSVPSTGNLELGTATKSLLNFLQERWKGVQPLMWGDQLKQARLDDWIFQGILDVEHADKSQEQS